MTELYYDQSIIQVDLDVTSNQEALENMAATMAEKGFVTESFKDALINREAAFPTGLPTQGVSVAIPHTDIEHVIKKSISVAILKKPVEFGIMGDLDSTTPVKIIFLLAMDETHAQLVLLQQLMQVFQNEEQLTYLANQKDKQNIKRFLEEELGFTLKGGE
ncbi:MULTISPECIES: PTS sugar transporter subunit IIA [Virgibacillus]|uniref:Multiphosphoryl transfer protein 1 n=2 Tax=Virgibacillus TaxID=84406 RepID=A0A024Q954_9BACI|nr:MULTISPECIES: PTS sugar transporter subunit IIA [Virgibacillus]EQB38037.1 hypothetical protein M948_05560 [Virgibacillus sp. CM-4]MYL40754.1 PTS sugar transporter subunit IIA [Virgibacillus massiliensis]GGJ51503.1 PTS sugar transporter subunit IIA [Virgibacillus kapii]CDQ38451.1 Multiphosphoryl transfer protein 1 [Virgibacillus massiliensis]